MIEPPRVPPADGEPGLADDALLDTLDDVVLGQVRAAYDSLDPPPAELNDRVRFAIRLENADIEVGRLYEDTLTGAGTRAGDRIRTITFEAASMTIMVMVADPGTGMLRVEGWLAPAAALAVRLRTASAPLDTMADQHGRFVFHDVPGGVAQFAIHRPLPARDTATVVTTAVTL